MLPTVSLQNMRVIRSVTRMLDAQSTHITHGVEHVLIPILCRTPTFLLKETKETAPPQKDEEDAMDEDGESVEEGHRPTQMTTRAIFPHLVVEEGRKVLRNMTRRNRPLKD